METLNDERDMEFIRTIIGTICLLFSLVFTFGCFIYCIIKCDEKENKNIIHSAGVIRVRANDNNQVTYKFEGLV